MSQTKQTADSKRLDKSTEQGADNKPARSPAQLHELEQEFKRDNAEGFASMNAWVEEHGLPLEKYRQF